MKNTLPWTWFYIIFTSCDSKEKGSEPRILFFPKTMRNLKAISSIPKGLAAIQQLGKENKN